MSRVLFQAEESKTVNNGKELTWRLLSTSGGVWRLRKGGYFAGHENKAALKENLLKEIEKHRNESETVAEEVDSGIDRQEVEDGIENEVEEDIIERIEVAEEAEDDTEREVAEEVEDEREQASEEVEEEREQASEEVEDMIDGEEVADEVEDRMERERSVSTGSSSEDIPVPRAANAWIEERRAIDSEGNYSAFLPTYDNGDVATSPSPRADMDNETKNMSDNSGEVLDNDESITKKRRLPMKSASKAKKRSKAMAKKQRKKPDKGSEKNAEVCSDDEMLSSGPINAEDLRLWTAAEINTEDPPICILCDDGGQLIYCEGPCHRHFHPCDGAGSESLCQTLGLNKATMKAKYYCPNCATGQQQCFICEELGSSVARLGVSLKVRCCEIPSCNRFYHVECVAKMVAPRKDQRALTRELHQGSLKFCCPRHRCSVCGEEELGDPGYLVQCRRCPRAWHRECLTDFTKSKERQDTPIWVQHQRQFIYCRRHEIIPELQTPQRNHVRFPIVTRQ